MATEVIALKDRLAEIVGRENVLDSPEIIQQCGKDYSLETPGSFTCVVRPGTVKETQQVIQLANEAKFAVVPQSSRIHFNGGAVPKQGGVVLDLSRMNRVAETIEESKIAYLQVGVTWEQFQTTLEARGYRGLIPLLPHASRSVIMDWLEREQPVVQNYEFAEPLLSVQVVWGNGELMATGSASIGHFRNPGVLAEGVCPDGPGFTSWDQFLYGSQGTMGVVTWGVVGFEPIPTLTKTFFIPMARAEDAIEPLYQLLRRGVCYECLLVNNIVLASILTERWPRQFSQLRAILPPWTAILIAGALKRRPERRIAYQEEVLMDIMRSQFQGLGVLTTLPGVAAVEKRLPDMLRKPWPKDKTYWKHAYKGGCQELMFITTLDRVGNFIPPVLEIAGRHQYSASDVGCYIQPVQDGRACQLQFHFYYDPGNNVEKDRIRSLHTEAAAAVLDRGAYFNRPYPMVADMVYRKHGDYATILKRLKKLFDPNNVLNPGNLCF